MSSIADFGSLMQIMISSLIKRIFLGMKGMLSQGKLWIEYLVRRLESLRAISQVRCHTKISCGSCYVRRTKHQ